MINKELSLQIDLIIIPAFAEIIAGDMKDSHRVLRFEAVRRLRSVLNYYANQAYRDDIICAIAEKKVKMILSATNKTDMDRILRPRAPTYNGSTFIPDKFSVPEEELICWCEISLRGPLIHEAYKRYSDVFKTVFPDMWEEVFGRDGD